MLKRQKSSAKFKKDYVAFLAILIFIVVVCSEITLSIWLPMEMRSADAWAAQVSKQRMIDNFDTGRRIFEHALQKKKVDEAMDEMQIIKDTLDQNARFLRINYAKLSKNQNHTLSDDYRTFTKLSIRYHYKNSAIAYYCYRKKLDTAKIIQRLSAQLKVKK